MPKTSASFTIMGMDYATKNTGYAVVQVNPKAKSIIESGIISVSGATGRRKPGKRGPDSRIEKWEDRHQFERIREMRQRVVKKIAQHEPAFVVLEGYGYQSKNNSHLPYLAEGTSLIKDWMFDNDLPYVVVTPSQLKKFSTGKGNCKKEQIRVGVLDLTEEEYESHDESDAIMCGAFGACWCGGRWISNKGKYRKWPLFSRESVKSFKPGKNGCTVQSQAELLSHVHTTHPD